MSGLRMAAGHGPRDRGARGHRDRGREPARPRAADREHRAQAGREAADRQVPRLRLVEPAIAAVAARPGPPGARRGPPHGLGRAAEEQREYLADFWERADIQLDGDAALQQAVRFALFHVVQAAARAELRAIPAKGLTGSGYDGHTFWDMDAYTLPVLTYVAPRAARDAIAWRHATMDLAASSRPRARAQGGDVPVADDPRSGVLGLLAGGHGRVPHQRRRRRRGPPVSRRHRRRGVRGRAPDSSCWSRPPGCGGRSATTTPRAGSGSTGSPVRTSTPRSSTTTSITNLMAARNMAVAADLAVRHPRRADELGIDEEEIASWRDAAAAIVVPFDRDARITQQCNGFTRLRKWDFEDTPADQYPLLLHYHNYMLYSSQVIKQADLVFAIYLCGDRWPAGAEGAGLRLLRERHRARLIAVGGDPGGGGGRGRPPRARLRLPERDRVHRPARPGQQHQRRRAPGRAVGGVARDRRRLRRHARPRRDAGVRAAAPVADDPPAVRAVYRGRRLRIEVSRDHATYELLDGEPLEIVHHGERVTVEPGGPQTCPVPPAPQYPPAPLPHGREPAFAHGEIHPLPQAPHGGGALPPPARRAEPVSATQP